MNVKLGRWVLFDLLGIEGDKARVRLTSRLTGQDGSPLQVLNDSDTVTLTPGMYINFEVGESGLHGTDLIGLRFVRMNEDRIVWTFDDGVDEQRQRQIKETVMRRFMLVVPQARW